MEMRTHYPIIFWRPFVDIAVCWGVVIASWWILVNVSWWLLIILAPLIANRFLALSLLGHEALHANLHSNTKLGDFLGRYFCAFPTLISFNKYRRLHLLHHTAIGSTKWDPDRHLYDFYPSKPGAYLLNLFFKTLTLRTFVDFLSYYTELPELIARKKTTDGRLFATSSRSDLLKFLFFHAVAAAGAISSGYLVEYILFYWMPILFIMHPYVLLMGGLQHGPVSWDGSDKISRTIRGSPFYMWLLLPCDIGFHAEHHKSASVPHYWLRQYSKDLESSGQKTWHTSYPQALKELFKPRA